MSDFHDKTVVITGASGGIGRAVAERFARAGARLVLHANKNVAPLRQTFDRTRCEILQADFQDPAERENFTDGVLEKFSKIDAWVNAAGLDLMAPSLKTLPFEKKLHHLFEVDVFAAIDMSKKVARHLKRQGGGTIVLLAWDGVEFGWAGETGELYGAAKGALLGFARSLAESAAPEVRVRCLCPGWIKTRWGEKACDDFSKRVAADSLQGRWGEPEDVAEAVFFFCRDASAYLDGIGVRINGGKRGTK